MAKHLLLAVMLAGVVTALPAQSPPPPPSPSIGSQSSKDNSSSEQSDRAKQNELILNQSAAHNESDNSHDRQRRDETANERIARFTVVLAIVGFLQVMATVVQAIYMHKGLKVTKLAADAAKQSADTAAQAINTSLVTERAIVLIDSVVLNTCELEYMSIVLFTLKNSGRTIAHSVELTGMLYGLGQRPLEKTPPATIAPDGSNTWITDYLGAWLNGDENIKNINVGLSDLRYRIDVSYMDIFRQQHSYQCEGKYEPNLKKFITTSSTSD